MPVPLEAFVPLFAQAPAGGAASPGGGLTQMLIMFAPVVLLFYFLILRPQQQQERQRKKMIDALKKNDRVVTAAGIYGTVVSLDTEADRVVLRVDDDKGVKLAFNRASIIRVIDSPSADKDRDKVKDKAAEPA